MKTAILCRFSDDTIRTLGVMILLDGFNIIFDCKTIELPWKYNQKNISCIPKGEYECEMTYSNKFKREMYLIKGVKDRAGIRIHSANFVKDLQGCLALGTKFMDIDKDGIIDLALSSAKIGEFEALMKKENFKLKIVYV